MVLIESEPFDRVRTDSSGSTGTDGRYVEGSKTTDRFEDGSFQPVATQDLERLEQGKRARAELTLYTAADLRTADQHDDVPSDRVIYRGTNHPEHQGDRFEVQRVESRETLIGGSKYILLREQES